ncbi:MAG: response regulator transcription factor [Candidatus Eisenbacteria bacterium]|nr:response regulator transcription factor [Candidatus Eisenbacteria bacterium]
MLRRDSGEFVVPIILVSASGETDARLRGLAAGADDFLAKPFSPRELIARSRRLLARAADLNEARRRTRELERDLTRAQDDIKRSMIETRREQRLRELALSLTREFHRVLDVDPLARRILAETQARFGVGTVALLLPDSGSRAFVPFAVRGDGLDRMAALEFAGDGALARLLAALGRPAIVRELERLPELAHELPPLIAARFARVAPLGGPEGLEGLLLADERLDGMEPTRAELEMLEVLCEVSGAALRTARRFGERLDLELDRIAPVGEVAACAAEAAALVDRAARVTLLPPRMRSLVVRAVRFAASGVGDGAESDSRAGLERMASQDPSGRAADLLRLIEAKNASTSASNAGARSDRADDPGPEWARAAALLAVAHAVTELRAARVPAPEALRRAVAANVSRLDPATAQALESTAREAEWLAGQAPVTSSSVR